MQGGRKPQLSCPLNYVMNITRSRCGSGKLIALKAGYVFETLCPRLIYLFANVEVDETGRGS